LYAKFIDTILKRKSPDSQLMENIESLMFDDAEISPSRRNGHAFFLGCLAARGLVPIGRVFDFALSLKEEDSESSLEAFYNLLVPCGKRLETTFPEFSMVFDSLAERKPRMKTRIGFFMSDLLDARKNNWNTESLFPRSLVRPNVLDSGSYSQGERILRQYIYEKEIQPFWSDQMTCEVMVALCIGAQEDFGKGSAIFGELKARRQLNDRKAARAIRSAIKEVEHVDEIDFPHARSKCGAIFARLVHDQVITLSLFGDKSGLPFSWEFFEGFLNECWNLNMHGMLSASPYMKGMRFRPRLFSHNQFLHVLDDTGMLECWPVYAAMAELYYAIQDGMDQEGLREMVHGFGVAIIESVDFVEFAVEFFVIHKTDDYVDLFAELIEKNLDAALSHLERVGEYLQWGLPGLAEEIRGLTDFLEVRDLTRWLRTPGGPIHTELSEILLGDRDL
jgi:hypothetical protein